MKDILLRIESLLIQLLGKLTSDGFTEPALVSQQADAWLRADEVMRILGVSEKTLYNYTRKGAFLVRKIGSTRWYCKASIMSVRNHHMK